MLHTAQNHQITSTWKLGHSEDSTNADKVAVIKQYHKGQATFGHWSILTTLGHLNPVLNLVKKEQLAMYSMLRCTLFMGDTYGRPCWTVGTNTGDHSRDKKRDASRINDDPVPVINHKHEITSSGAPIFRQVGYAYGMNAELVNTTGHGHESSSFGDHRAIKKGDVARIYVHPVCSGYSLKTPSRGDPSKNKNWDAAI